MNVAETLARLGAEVEEEEEEVMDEEVEEEEEEVMVVVEEEEEVMARQIIEVGDIGLVEEVVGSAIIIGTMEDPEGVVATAIITTAVMVEDVIVVATAMHKEEIVATTNGKHPQG